MVDATIFDTPIGNLYPCGTRLSARRAGLEGGRKMTNGWSFDVPDPLKMIRARPRPPESPGGIQDFEVAPPR